MRHLLTITAVLLLATPAVSRAQQATGFVTGGATRDVNHEDHTTVGGGVLVDWHGWIAAGGQIDVMLELPYMAARGGPVVQPSVFQNPHVRLFGLVGYLWGEDPGANLGGGLEWHPRGRTVAIRATAQDTFRPRSGFDCAAYGIGAGDCQTYFHGGRSWTGHVVSWGAGVSWR